ncbi:MAG: NAD(P)-binding domain-containing protein [Proteobacteria bacterium]|nr:NAD(P)-binding domain-containing protein [Pseudomonadota bacterium]
MQLQNIKRVGIIGSGVAGLATAKTLLAQDLECTVFDRAERLGGVWADGYSNFGVQAPMELYQFPDWPLPEGTPNFTPGPIFQQYLEDYADNFGLRDHIRLQSRVTKVARRSDEKPGWTLTIRVDSYSYEEDFDLVVIATGLYSDIPNVPSLPGESEFKGAILHNSAIKTRDPLEGRRVAVIGYGKSATDAAQEAVAVAQETHIIFRTPHWPVPRDLAGILPFKWGMLSRMTGKLIAPYQRSDVVARSMHKIGKPIVWIFWRLVEVLLYFQCHLGTKISNGKNLVPTVPVEIDCFGESTMVPRPALYKLIREGRITAHRTEIDHYTANGIALANGEELDVDCVVFATGWKNDYVFLPEEARQALGTDDDGFYLYRHILHPELPNLAFIGNASTFLSVLTYSLQARWLAELIAGHVALPDETSMLEEIKAMKAWKRSWMPFSAARGARLLLHMLSYHDELLTDFGANPLRKRGLLAPLKELLVPYHPTDYDVIVSGDWEAIEGRSPV